VHLAPPLGLIPFEFTDISDIRKQESLTIVRRVRRVILRLAVSVEHRLVTDGRTRDDGIYRASMASRGKNVASLPVGFIDDRPVARTVLRPHYCSLSRA